MSPTSELRHFRSTQTAVAVTVTLFLLTFGRFLSAQPYTVTFYVPLPEGNVRSMLYGLNTATGSDITSVISIVTMESKAVIVYDHWEDGYEADINNPVQPSTLVFGDMNMANGDLGVPPSGSSCFPVCPVGDMPLPPGLILTLRNTMNANPTRGNSPIRFDGKDRISSNRGLSVSRAAWSPNAAPIAPSGEGRTTLGRA